MELRGAVAIVTGAAHGIGAATTAELTARGATVVAADVDADRLAEVAAETGATAFPCDVRDLDHGEKLVDFARSTHGRLDIVVANAGIGYAGDFATMPDDRLVQLLDINVRAPMLLTRAALPGMVEQRSGAVVLVTSIAGTLLIEQESAYSASKAALEAFAVPLRDELHGTGVTVSTLRPAVVATHFFDERGAPYHRRWPRPVDASRIAKAVVRAVENGPETLTVPPWLRLPMAVQRVAPRFYRSMSRRFG